MENKFTLEEEPSLHVLTRKQLHLYGSLEPEVSYKPTQGSELPKSGA